MRIRIRDKFEQRTLIISILLVTCFIIILVKLVYLTTVKNVYYKEQLAIKTDNTVYGTSTPRGRIYDRNMNLLVDNKELKTIYYSKPKNVDTSKEIKLAYEVSKNLKLNYNSLNEQMLKKFFVLTKESVVNKRITAEEYEKYKNRIFSSDDIYKLKLDRVTKDDISIYKDDDKKAIYLYYLMNEGYYYDEKIIKNKDVTDSEYAYIAENIDKLSGFNIKLSWERIYLYNDALRSIYGDISTEKTGLPYELKDYYLSKGYAMNDRVGISGLEYKYESILKGKKSKYKINSDNKLDLIEEGTRGNDIVLTIDIKVQAALEKILKEEMLKAKKEKNTEYYDHSYVIIEDPQTGEILAMSGKKMVYNKRTKKYDFYDITSLIGQETVTAGSIVKGASIMVGYNSGVIKYGTKMRDACIKVGNGSKCSWTTLGMVNDQTAIKYSSNVYQYKTALQISKQRGLEGSNNAFQYYRNMYYQFGLGVQTGIDFTDEIVGYKGSGSSIGLLMDFAIGQYDTYTPIQISQYIATIANDGNRVIPFLLKEVYNGTNNEKVGSLISKTKATVLNKINTKESNIKRVQSSFKMVMNGGTGTSYILKKYNASGKTGTSESFIDINNDGKIDKATLTKNFIAYAPSSNPIMSIMISSPNLSSLKRGDYVSNLNTRISKKVTDFFFKNYTKA